MTGNRKGVLVILALVLVVSLTLATIAVTADRTALSPEFASDTAEEAGVYSLVGDEVQATVTEDAPEEPEAWPLERTPEEMVADVFTEEQVRDQVDPNLESIYDYLHGDSDELELGFDVEPIVDDLTAEIETDLRATEIDDFDLPEADTMAAMAEDEETFAAEQSAFKEEQKAEIQDETDEELSDEELEEEYENRIDEIVAEHDETLEGDVDQELGDDEISQAMAGPATDIVSAYVDARAGLIGYDEYTAQLDAGHDALVDAVVDGIEAEIEGELGAEVDLAEELDDDAMAYAEDAQGYVSMVTTIMYTLLALSLVLIGIVAVVGTPAAAAITVGVSAAVAGVLGIVGAIVTGNVATAAAEDTLDEVATPELIDRLVLGLIEGIISAWQFHSIMLVGLGVVVLGLGVAIQQGMLPADMPGAEFLGIEDDEEE